MHRPPQDPRCQIRPRGARGDCGQSIAWDVTRQWAATVVQETLKTLFPVDDEHQFETSPERLLCLAGLQNLRSSELSNNSISQGAAPLTSSKWTCVEAGVRRFVVIHNLIDPTDDERFLASLDNQLTYCVMCSIPIEEFNRFSHR